MLQSEAMVAGEYCLWVCIRLRHAILGLGIRGSMHATHRCHGRCHNNQPGAYGKLGEYWKYRCQVNVPHPILQCTGQHYMQKNIVYILVVRYILRNFASKSGIFHLQLDTGE